jgi:hypothetical protein
MNRVPAPPLTVARAVEALCMPPSASFTPWVVSLVWPRSESSPRGGGDGGGGQMGENRLGSKEERSVGTMQVEVVVEDM